MACKKCRFETSNRNWWISS